jgi:hypothetical protein
MSKLGRWAGLVVWATVAVTVGCSGGGRKEAAREARDIQRETRTIDRITFNSTPEKAEAVLGRGPEAIHKQDDKEYRYYRVTGLPATQMLRLAFRNGVLVEKEIVNLRQEGR